MKNDRPKRVIAAEADMDLVEQIDAVADRLRGERPGTRVTRSDAIRALILAGLACSRAA